MDTESIFGYTFRSSSSFSSSVSASLITYLFGDYYPISSKISEFFKVFSLLFYSINP